MQLLLKFGFKSFFLEVLEKPLHEFPWKLIKRFYICLLYSFHFNRQLIIDRETFNLNLHSLCIIKFCRFVHFYSLVKKNNSFAAFKNLIELFDIFDNVDAHSKKAHVLLYLIISLVIYLNVLLL